MILTNYHTHGSFCDGVQEPEQYILTALKKGFKALGFSSHAPLPFVNHWTMKADQTEIYLKEINRLKTKYQNEIEIYLGMEIDYFPEKHRNLFRQFYLDYTLGSVHCIADFENEKCYSIDGSKEEFDETLSKVFDSDIRKFVSRYYELIKKMAVEEKPDIIGHFDVIKKNNQAGRYYSESESWYRSLVKDTLEVIAQKQVILEVNTGGILRGYTTEFYPSPWILQEALKMDIPIMLNSDAHAPENLDGYFIEARKILREIGYTKQRVLLNQHWQDIRL